MYGMEDEWLKHTIIHRDSVRTQERDFENARIGVLSFTIKDRLLWAFQLARRDLLPGPQ